VNRKPEVTDRTECPCHASFVPNFTSIKSETDVV